MDVKYITNLEKNEEKKQKNRKVDRCNGRSVLDCCKVQKHSILTKLSIQYLIHLLLLLSQAFGHKS